jgi:inner membrane protein
MCIAVPEPRSRWVATLWPLLAVLVVIGLDLVADAGSRSTPEVAAFDEPAHLATGILVVLALIALAPAPRSIAFVAAALVASVAIDLDHLPQYLGWSGLTEGTPRPYTHSLVTPLVLAALALAVRGRLRAVALGAAVGVLAHLLRDLSTASGVALLWPLSDAGARIPYWTYLLALALLALLVTLSLARDRRRAASLRSRAWPAWRTHARPASGRRRAAPGRSSPPARTDAPADSDTRTRPGPRPSPGISSAGGRRPGARSAPGPPC